MMRGLQVVCLVRWRCRGRRMMVRMSMVMVGAGMKVGLEGKVSFQGHRWCSCC